jgi:uncharacterized membrane protein
MNDYSIAIMQFVFLFCFVDVKESNTRWETIIPWIILCGVSEQINVYRYFNAVELALI